VSIYYKLINQKSNMSAEAPTEPVNVPLKEEEKQVESQEPQAQP
jgi:hypothetical protein